MESNDLLEEESNDLLEKWQQTAHILHRSHAQLAWFNDLSGRALGLLATVFSAIVATSIFATLTRSDKTIWLIGTGVFSIFTIILSSASQYLKLPDLSVRHNYAVDLYGKLRRDIEIALHEESEGKKISEARLKELSNEWADLDRKNLPPVSTYRYKKVKKEIEKEEQIEHEKKQKEITKKQLSDPKKNESIDNK